MISYDEVDLSTLVGNLKGVTTISAAGSVECCVEDNPEKANREFTDWLESAEDREGSVAAIHRISDSTICLLQVVDGKPMRVSHERSQKIELSDTTITTAEWDKIMCDNNLERISPQQRELLRQLRNNGNMPLQPASILSSPSVMQDLNQSMYDRDIPSGEHPQLLPFRVKKIRRENDWSRVKVRMFRVPQKKKKW